MGSANSRIESRPTRRRPENRRRIGISACLCFSAVAVEAETSAASSSAPPLIDFNSSMKSVLPARGDVLTVSDNLQTSEKDSSANFSAQKGTSSSMTEDIRFQDSVQRNNRINSESLTELQNVDFFPSSMNISQTRSARTSVSPSNPSEAELLELRSMQSSSGSPLEVGSLVTELGSGTMSTRLPNDMPQFEHVGSGTASTGVPGLTTQRNRGDLPVDLSNVSASLPSSSGEISIFEARRNSRRLFWDALSRRISRRNIESSESLLSTESSASRDRWLFNFDDHNLVDDLEDDSISLRHLRRRRHGLSGLTWNSRSEEIRDRIQSGLHGNNDETTYCQSGLHLDGTCSCNALVVAEGPSTRASFSRIVMLAEALFENNIDLRTIPNINNLNRGGNNEDFQGSVNFTSTEFLEFKQVLDEIHRQPGPLGISAVSVPAPDFIVNSLPLKIYRKLEFGERGDENEQCYICLSEYENGESIRTLPCRHEYHMSCVDKWLKEIHGVCPLCRGNVTDGCTDGPDSIL